MLALLHVRMNQELALMANVVMSHFSAKSATPFMAVLAIVWMGPALLAQSLIKDPVDEFRLWLGAGSSGDRPVKIREALMAMKSAGEVGRTLLLPDWQGQYRDGINKDSFEATVKRFVELARTGLQSREPLVQRQTARIIAEAGSINSGAQNYTGSERSVSRDSMLRASFSELQKELFTLASKGSASQLDALYALGRVDCSPVELGRVCRGILEGKNNPDDLKLRQAAADALNQRSLSVSVLARQGRFISTEETATLRQSFLQVGEQLIPVAVIGLADEERSVRMKSIDAINAITDALADSDILIRTTLDTALINDQAEKVSRLQELKAEQKSLSPLMKVLRGNIKTIAGLGLLPGRTIHTRVETLAILQDYALFRKRLSDQARKIEGSDDKKALLFPKELDPFPIDEQGIRPIVVSLIAGLKDVEWKVRLECACAIEMIFLQSDMLELVRATENGPLLGAILDLLPNENNVYVVLNLARVLSRIAPGQIQRILPVVVALLAHADIDVRIQSVAVIKNFGPDAQQAVPALAAMVVEGDADFRLAVIQAIEAVGRSARPALPAVAANLKHANPQVRTASARALGRFGGLADETLAALDAASDDSSSEVRLAISEAITRIRAGSR